MLLFVGLLAAAGLDQLLRPWASRAVSPLGEAEWIWSTDDPRLVDPRAFYLARDFELAAVPDEARLAVQGDEEYIAYLNGVRVGSNMYADGAEVDVFPVAPLLAPGLNRLVVEMRSTRGAGGLLLALQAMPEGRTLVASDRQWRLLRAASPGLVSGWDPLEPFEPVRVWGVPPTGRWGRARLGAPHAIVGHSSFGAEAAPLVRVAARPMRVPLDDPTLPSGATFDFGRPVTGYLEVRGGELATDVALLYVGTAAAPRVGVHQPVTAVVVPGGTTVWRDSVVRTVRFVRVLGWTSAATVEIVEVPAGEADRLAVAPARGGLLGIEVPWRPTPPDHKVWRRLRERGEL